MASSPARLVWLALPLAAIVAVATPLTTDAGEWLEDTVGRSPLLHEHTQLGDTMIYFAIALLIAAVMLAVAHIREICGKSVKPLATWMVAAVLIVVSVATAVQVYRIGDSGAKATWSDQTGAAQAEPGS